MKSVCLVVQNVYDVDPRVRRKAEALAAAGYSVDVLALRGPGGEKSYALNGVNVRTVSMGKKRGSLARYFFEYAAFFLWVFFRLPVQMLRRRYAAIDINSLPDFLVFAGVVTRWMGARLILDLHEITPEFYMSKYHMAENSWIVRVLKYLERISMDFADRVITINEPTLVLLAGRGLARAKATVMMNAVDEARFADPSSSSASGARAVGPENQYYASAKDGEGMVRVRKGPIDSPSFPCDKYVMMYHGTLTHIYGLDMAVEAFALAHQEMPEAELWILGSGSEKAALARLAEQRGVASRVKLVGQVASSEIPAWLSRCDAGILPIRQDVFLDFAFPNKLPEFIIMGKPVIISSLKAIRHYFSEDALAYFEPNAPEDLAKQMRRVYQDRDLRARLARQAREEYLPIRWEVMKERYLMLVGELTGPEGRHTAVSSGLSNQNELAAVPIETPLPGYGSRLREMKRRS